FACLPGWSIRQNPYPAAFADGVALSGGVVRDEPIADTADGLDRGGPVPELAPDRFHLGIDDVAATRVAVAPRLAQKGHPVDDAVRVVHEEPEHVRLELGEIHAPAVENELPLADIQELVVLHAELPGDEVRQPAVDRRRPEVEDRREDLRAGQDRPTGQ